MKSTIVFINGCFDIFHAGHARLLKKAAELGDFLYVGLNSDDSVRRLKGAGRPACPLDMRCEVLLSIRYVDCVLVFEEDTPEKLIESIRPDILVKGAEWINREVAGAEFVRSYGGKVVFLPREVEVSTTKILKGGK